MAKVTYKRVQTNDAVSGIPIVDGQLIYSKEGKTFMDYETTRVPINGTPDNAMSDSSTNPVENRAIKSYVDTNITTLANTIHNGTILWENLDPTEAWGSQRQITLSSSDYDCYIVTYFTGASSSTSGVKSTSLIPKGKTTQLEFFYNAGNGNNNAIIRRREFAYNDDTHYTVSANMGADGNYACRPWYVIGYNTGLF